MKNSITWRIAFVSSKSRLIWTLLCRSKEINSPWRTGRMIQARMKSSTMTVIFFSRQRHEIRFTFCAGMDKNNSDILHKRCFSVSIGGQNLGQHAVTTKSTFNMIENVSALVPGAVGPRRFQQQNLETRVVDIHRAVGIVLFIGHRRQWSLTDSEVTSQPWNSSGSKSDEWPNSIVAVGRFGFL